jgi:hypothetical protein
MSDPGQNATSSLSSPPDSPLVHIHAPSVHERSNPLFAAATSGPLHDPIFAPPPPTSTQFKQNKPPRFAGDLPQPELAQAAIRWLFLLTIYITSIATGGTTDDMQVAMAVSFLDGPALDWAMTYMADFTTFHAFKSAFTTFCSPLDPDFANRQLLSKCTQTSTVTDFLQRFTALSLRIPKLDAADKHSRFLQGLKQPVRQYCILLGSSTFQDAALMASRYELAMDTNDHNNRAPPAPNPPAPQPRPNNPPRINAMPPPPDRPPRLPITPEQRAYLMDNNGCVYCRALGHTVLQCPTRPPGPRPFRPNGPPR